MSEERSTANRQIARAAGTVMVAFVIGNLIGLVRQILVANAFGTQPEMEAFNAANRVSETLFNLAAGGALSSAFIPIFTSLLATGKSDRAWRLASAIANIVCVVIIFVGVMVMIGAPWIVRNILAPGFIDDPEKLALTIKLMRWMLPSTIIFGLSGLLMGVLNSHQQFFYPAIAPAMYQLGLIFGVVVLSPRFGIFGLAWGVILGAVLHFLVQLPGLFRLNGNYFLTMGLDSSDVREVAKLMAPRLLGVAVVQINFWVNTRLASELVEGSVTGIVLAFSLMLMPQAAIAQSIAIAAMPTFSAQVALGRLEDMRSSLSASLRGSLLLAIPASVGLMLLRTPVVQMLYERGEFDEFSSQLVSWALLWFASGMVGHTLVEILSRAFYALHDTRTPVLVGVIAMSLNIIFSYLFSGLFEALGILGLGGLALANSLATVIEAVGLWIIMRRRLNGLDEINIVNGVARSGLATLAMIAGLLGWLAVMGSRPPLVSALGGITLGGCIYILTIFVLGVDEVQLVFRALKKRPVR